MKRSTTQRLIWLLLAAAGVAVLAIVGVYWWTAREAVTIGVEGRRVIEIVGPELHAAPFTPGDALSVRIAGVERMAKGLRYDLRFIAYGPGEHDLTELLFLADRAKPEGLPPLVVRVDSVLPADHKGDLLPTSPSAIDLHSYYGPLMAVAWCAWGLLLIPLMLYGRRRHVRKPQQERIPTTKERLAALLNEASRERLPVEKQAELERLLVAFWSQRLNLPQDDRLIHTLTRLRKHPKAGPQITRIETWLHRRDACGESPARELLSEIK